MIHRPRRSALYMPGSNARALEKAKTLDADVIILDLEDAVVPDAKPDARAQVCTAVRAGGFGRREVVIRVNALDSAWGLDDLAAVAQSGAHAILLPKVSTPGDIMMCARHVREHSAPDDLRLWAMMETPLALLNAGSIAATAQDPQSRLDVMVLGTNDLAKETRARLIPGRAPMMAWMQMILAAARAHGVEVLDGVFNDLGNEAGFRTECEQGRDMGLDGKTLIHPNQLAICNEVFAPDAAELIWAREIIAEFDLPENAAKGAVHLKGRMIERLHADMARRTLALAEAIAAP